MSILKMVNERGTSLKRLYDKVDYRLNPELCVNAKQCILKT